MPTGTQPRDALRKHANPMRAAMADVKRQLRRGGRIRAANMLRDPAEPIKRMQVGVFLCAIQRVSQRSAVRLLRDAGLPAGSITWRIGPLYEKWTDTNMRTLTSRQRLVLAAVLARPTHHA